ncbi:MAG TPA: ATP-binding protein [Ktedonobacterales bacterium]
MLPRSAPRLAAEPSPDLAQQIVYLERLASAGAEGLVVADTHDRCVFLNDLAATLGRSVTELNDLPVSAWLSHLLRGNCLMHENRPTLGDPVDIAALAASRHWLRFTSSAGSDTFHERKQCYALAPYPLYNEAGTLLGYALFLRNMMPLMQDEALENGLLSSVSHDLRTPLMVIKAAVTGLLQEGLQWDEALRRETLQDINEETDRLTTLVSALLEMSRIQGGALQLQTEWCDLAEIIHTVLDRLQKVTSQHRIVYDVAVSLPLIQGDFMQLDRVLSNLIENAAKYSPAGTEIRVTASLAEGEVQVSVQDQGCGIPAEERERVFEKFYRVKQRRGRSEALNDGFMERHAPTLAGGSGLGLAICRGIILAHQGRIWVEARAGKGSRFVFALPVEQSAPMTGRVAHDSGPFGGAPGPETSLEQEAVQEKVFGVGEESEEVEGAV